MLGHGRHLSGAEYLRYRGFVRPEMGVDPAFQGAGQMPGLEIWRIEKMKVCPIPKNTYGKFYNGDSYIILDTVKISHRIEWHIHFWLGKESTRDEAGAAAIKSVELDDHLGGGPIQHREVQDHESDRFQSMFKSGVQYLEGGVDSGFVDTSKLKFNKRLYHIKGRRKVRITQTLVSWESLNEGDVFVLDCKDTVWCWVGDECSRLEKIKGMEFARKVKDEEKGGRATLVLAEDERLKNKFLEELEDVDDPRHIRIKSAGEGGDDDAVDKVERKIALFRVCDESGELEITEVGKSPLRHEMLDTNDCFILDMGQSGVYAWIGKKATADERREAFTYAQQFIETKGYPNWTPLCRVVEEAEDNLFTSCFSNWPSKNLTKPVPVPDTQTPTQKKKEVEMDLSSLHKAQNRDQLMQEDVKDDGCGKVKIWRVENFDLVDVNESLYGTFWDGDSYLILYTYIAPGRSHESFIIYFWLGTHSSTDERGAAALHATRVDGEVGWSSQQVRVVQGKEPLHFLRMFGRRITVLTGGIASGFRKQDGANDEEEEIPSERLFHIKCVKDYVKSIELQCRAASLNSNDSFVLLTIPKTYIWYGKGCDAEERYTARLLAEKVDRNMLIGVNGLQGQLVEMEEGNEPDEFWEYLGGKGDYASGMELESLVNERPPRLFQMSNASGYFKVEEVYNFNQDDLIEEDTMLLDTGNTLFVWVGSGANEIEKKQGLLAAREYLKQDPSGRSEEDIQMLAIKQGVEPPSFTGHFQAWDSRKWSGGKTYEEMAQSMGFNTLMSVDEELEKYSMKHSYEVLVKKVVPEGVDIVNKERYLKDEDFKDVFGMTLAEYDQLAEWKRLRLKKSVNLF